MLVEKAKSLRVIDEQLLNVSFWRDNHKIEQYCTAILKYAGKVDVKVDVHESKAENCFAGRYKNDDKHFMISVPNMPTFFKTADEQARQTYMRSILLRHELAHILFTDYEFQFTNTTPAFQNFVNCIDDIVIEKKYGRTFRGSNRAFRELRRVFFKAEKLGIETRQPNGGDCMFYVQNRLMGWTYTKTMSTAKYEPIFQEFKKIDTLSGEEYNNALTALWARICDAFPSVKDFDRKDVGDDVPSEKNGQESTEEQDGEESTEEGEGDSDQSGKSNESEESDESKSNEDLEGSSEGDGKEGEDSESANNSDSSEQGEGDIESTPGDNENFSSEDGNRDRDIESAGADDNSDDNEDLEDLLGDEVKSLSDMQKELSKNEKFTIEDVRNQEIDESMFHGAIEIPLIALSRVGAIINLEKRGGQVEYNKAIARNHKTISDLIRFLKLKIQHRTYNRQLNFQAEGELDECNLKEVVVNSESPRAFYRKLVKIEPKSRIHMLIDISGSMNPHQVECTIVNAIILTETCKQLDIPYSIGFFTSFGIDNINIKPTKKHAITVADIRKNFAGTSTAADLLSVWSVIHRDWKPLYDNSLPGSYVVEQIRFTNRHHSKECNSAYYYVKKAFEKHSSFYENVLGNLWLGHSRLSHRLRGSTPEFQATVQIYKTYKNYSKNILFIINDGSFDSIQPGDNFDREESIGSSDPYSYDVHCKQMRQHSMPGTPDTYLKKTDALKHASFVRESMLKNVQMVLSDEEVLRMVHVELVGNKRVSKDVSNLSLADLRKKINLVADTHIQMLDILESIISSKNEELFDFSDAQLIAETFAKDCIRAFGIDERTTRAKQFFSYSRSTAYRVGFDITLRYLIGAATGDYSLDTICEELRKATQIMNDYSNLVYRSIIKKMRNEGWKVFGVGICANAGFRYIGHDNFISIADTSELSTVFSKRLREIF